MTLKASYASNWLFMPVIPNDANAVICNTYSGCQGVCDGVTVYDPGPTSTYCRQNQNQHTMIMRNIPEWNEKL